MTKKLKCFVFVLMICLLITPTFKAFFMGSDTYGLEEYKEANVTWKHNKIFLDDYHFGTQSINQKLAEQLTTLYRNIFKKENSDRTKDENMYQLYLKVAQFVINISKGLSNETALWQLMYLNK